MRTRKITNYTKEQVKLCNNDVICSDDLIVGSYIKISHKDLVWFGSIGVDSEGKSIKAYDISKYDVNARANRKEIIDKNYVKDLIAIANSLQQKLSVIKGELLYHSDFGIPLFDKDKTKLSIDSSIIEILLNTSGVRELVKFSSNVKDRKYTCEFSVNTIYGILNLSIQ